MSNWAYCKKCGGALSRPTPREVIEGYYCPHCGMCEDPRMTKDELILELFDRIAELEKKL